MPPKQPFNFHSDSCNKGERRASFQLPLESCSTTLNGERSRFRVINKKKRIDKSFERERERRKKTQAAKYQTEREGRGKKAEKGSRISLENSLFFPPSSSPAFSNYTKEPTDRTPIFNLTLCRARYTDPYTEHKRMKWSLVRRYSSMKIETKHANFSTRENYPRETSY